MSFALRTNSLFVKGEFGTESESALALDFELRGFGFLKRKKEFNQFCREAAILGPGTLPRDIGHLLALSVLPWRAPGYGKGQSARNPRESS